MTINMPIEWLELKSIGMVNGVVTGRRIVWDGFVDCVLNHGCTLMVMT